MALKSVGYRFAMVLSIGLWMAADAAAVQVVFSLVTSQSDLTLNGDYGGFPFIPQDDPELPTPGVTDGDPTRPSNRTSFQGTITVDVDNVAAPTSIQILSASIDALTNGSWLPDAVPGLEDEQNCKDNPGGPRCSSIYPPDPAKPADIAVKLNSFGGDVAFGAYRDLNYNLKTEVDPDGICETHDSPHIDMCPLDFEPVVEPVNPQGEFSSLSQHFTFNSGYFDTWQHPLLKDDRDRDSIAGDDLAMNQSEHTGMLVVGDPDLDVIVIEPLANALKSTYVVSGNLATLTIPVNFVVHSDLSYTYDGQLVATFSIPAGSDGDHNKDGIVNAADYPAWRKIPSLFGGDPAGYEAWRTQFGEPAPGGSAPVPEPAAAALIAVGFAGVLLGRRWPNR